jgi:hypothetical protein
MNCVEIFPAHADIAFCSPLYPVCSQSQEDRDYELIVHIVELAA